MATIFTGLIAIISVILSQLWVDSRQRKDHKHQVKLKNKESLLKKKEEVIDICNQQVKFISEVELTFDSWYKDFDTNFDATKIRILQTEIDGNVSKLHLIINLYFPELDDFIVRILDDTQEFIVFCADYSMGGRFGKEDYLKLDSIEVAEVSNKYAVSFMYLSSNLTRRSAKEI